MFCRSADPNETGGEWGGETSRQRRILISTGMRTCVYTKLHVFAAIIHPIIYLPLITMNNWWYNSFEFWNLSWQIEFMYMYHLYLLIWFMRIFEISMKQVIKRGIANLLLIPPVPVIDPQLLLILLILDTTNFYNTRESTTYNIYIYIYIRSYKLILLMFYIIILENDIMQLRKRKNHEHNQLQ